MNSSTLKLTRKIQLLVDLPTQEEKKEALAKLYQWQNRAFRAANMMVSHLYVQEMIKDFLYLTEKVQYKLADEKKDELGILKCSRIHSTYRAVANQFRGEIPSNILTNLKQSLYSSFNRDKMKYWSGEISLKNFRRDMAFPFDMEGISGFSYVEEKKAFCFRLFSIPLKTYLGKDYTDKRKLLEQFINGKIKICTSHLKLKDGKIFWLPVFEIKKEEFYLRPEVIAEATLSLEHPIVVKTRTGRLSIGSREEFLYRRLAIQASHKRAQKGATFSKSGKGVKRKLKAVKKYKDVESNYVSNRIHVYSRRLIDFCIKHQARTLILMNQEDVSEIAKEEEFVLRNWSYYDLMTKIKYKAEKAGIEVLTN